MYPLNFANNTKTENHRSMEPGDKEMFMRWLSVLKKDYFL